MSDPQTRVPGASADQLEWHRVHPVTPLVRAWAAVLVLLFVLGNQALDSLSSLGEVAGQVVRLWWVAVLALLLFLLVVAGVSWLAWRMTTYAVDDTAAHLRKGILFRQQRHARLDRLQAVDVRQPLVARLFGLAELTLEVAGGADSAVRIGFLRLDDANALRADLLARAAGVKARRAAGTREPAQAEVRDQAAVREQVTSDQQSDAAGVPGAATGVVPDAEAPRDAVAAVAAPVPEPVLEAPENAVYEVPPGRLVASLLRLPVIWIILLAFVGLGVAVGVTRNFGLLGSVLPGLFGAGAYLFSRFAGEFGFRAAISPDGIRLRHGLLETRAQTIPPGRVQALSLTQGFWWRGKGWWRVKVNVAGYGVEGNSETQHVLLPVGPRDEALTALWLVLPDLRTDEVAPLLDEGLTGDARTDRWFTTSPRTARIFDPISWRRNGFAVAERVLLLRTGRLTRSLVVVPHERTQSLGVEQGPWQRRRGVASFAVHSTPGPVGPRVPHLASGVVAGLLDEQSVRARTARAHQPPERWMEQVTALPEVADGRDGTA
ncbi:PH domain-containing protein [Isoptericola chiayiensis]|uniref:PH domain-containing protein n=1 Tax=Isoptericola chiayiensis TaxID=579446 RepID=A0ABP8Y2Z7_9MICO|nr:putative membrane protein [Isoptericola chiayiensis]